MRQIFIALLFLVLPLTAQSAIQGRWSHQVQGSTTDLSNPVKACYSYCSSCVDSSKYVQYRSGTPGEPGHRLDCYSNSPNPAYYIGYITYSEMTVAEPVACPAGTEYVATGDAPGCYTEVQCTAGETFGSFVTREQFTSGANIYVVNYQGCVHEMTDLPSGEYGQYDDGTVGGNATYTNTGTKAADWGSTLPELSETAESPTGQGTSDTRTSTTEQTVGDKQVTDNGDGTTTEQQTTTETKVEGQGTVMWESGGKLYVQDSTGKVTTTTQQQLIDRAADNSYTETVTSNTTVTTPTLTTDVLDIPNKTTQTATTTGKTTTSGTTTTTNYNSSGVKTGSTSVSTGGGTGSGTGDGSGEGTGEGECDPQVMECGEGEDNAAGQPAFDVPTESWWESSYPEGLAGIWAEHSAALDSGPASTWLNSFGVPSSGSLPNWSFSCDVGVANFGTCDLSPPDYIWAAIRIFILLTAIFLCRRLIFGG